MNIQKENFAISTSATSRLQNLFLNHGVYSPINDSRIANAKSYFRDHTYILSEQVLAVDFVNKINNVDQESVFEIEKKTRDQYNSRLWVNVRKSRLTASIAGKICKTVKCGNMCKSYAKQIVKPTTFASDAMQYGKENEKNALKAYIETCGKDVLVRKCGFFIDQTHNF